MKESVSPITTSKSIPIHCLSRFAEEYEKKLLAMKERMDYPFENAET